MPPISAQSTSPAQAGASQDRRQYYRLKFPYSERPSMVVGARKYEVVDCSMRGIRYISKPTTLMKPGDSIQGLMKFRRRREMPIRGQVVHIHHDQIGICLQGSEIPLPTLWDEERYLQKYFPMPENRLAITTPSS